MLDKMVHDDVSYMYAPNHSCERRRGTRKLPNRYGLDVSVKFLTCSFLVPGQKVRHYLNRLLECIKMVVVASPAF